MRLRFRHIAFATVILLATVTRAPAQQMQQVVPHIGYVYPAGGRQGSTFQLTIGGQFLDGVSEVRVSGKGVTAKIVEFVKPMTQQQFNALRLKLEDLLEKRAAAMGIGGATTRTTRSTTRATWTAEDEKAIVEIRAKMAKFIRRPSSPAIAEMVTVGVSIAAGAQPGEREIRLETTLGLTNPLAFRIDQLPEFSKTTAAPVDQRTGPRAGASSVDMKVTAPAIINGQIMPGDVDRYHFAARKGQRLVIAASARELIPYLADAVPGWFQATLTFYDDRGRELAYDDDFRFHPDPVLYYEIQKDGEYTIEIKDAIYRGREDFVYRISVGELPFITSIFPLGAKAGSQTTVALRGWNLPVNALDVDARGVSGGVIPLSVGKGGLISNRVAFAVDTLDECLEQEPNDSPATAQPVKLPIIINGRINQSGDRDVFRFEGKRGERIVAEVRARRLDSPLDSVVTLNDATGRQIAFNDDHEDKGSGLLTHHADSYLMATLPADGTYFLQISDAQSKGGPEYAYHLRISSPRPDFELRVVPASVAARAGATVPITVYALRKDGFSGEIDLALKGAPAGFRLSGARIAAAQDQVRLTLTMPPTPRTEPVPLILQGRALIQGIDLVREAVPAEDMMQAFAYRHLVPAREWDVAVLRPYMPRRAMSLGGVLPVKIRPGGTARVQVLWAPRAFIGSVHFELSDPPEGITIKSASAIRQGMEIVLQCDAAKAKAGLKGNLIITASGDPPVGRVNTPAARRRAILGTVPAIPFEIAPR